MRDRAFAFICPVFMFGHVVAAPAVSEPAFVLRGAVDKFGVDDFVDREIAELLKARNEGVEFRERADHRRT